MHYGHQKILPVQCTVQGRALFTNTIGASMRTGQVVKLYIGAYMLGTILAFVWVVLK